MLIVSQHARLLHIPFPDYAVFRVNAAWLKNRRELFALLSKLRNDVFLDFPQGRLKPPQPVLNFSDLLAAMQRFDNIKYFGVSDVRNADVISRMRRKVPKRVQLIPKIESKEGIDNLEEIFSRLRKKERYIMLDKEDLYTDLKHRGKQFERYVKLAKDKCKKSGFTVLELQGVIFSEHTDN